MSNVALDYPLGRPIAPAITVRRRRPLPPGAVARVQAGNGVNALQPIAEITTQHGRAPVLAGIDGRVVAVTPGVGIFLEGVATLLQGMIGIGESAAGPLAFLPQGESPAVALIPRGAILVYPQPVPLTLLQRAAAHGAVGVIAASASALELESFARADISAVLEWRIPLPVPGPLVVILTEGLGNAAMQADMLALLRRREGEMALINGVSHPRQNMRPEVLLSGADTSLGEYVPQPVLLRRGALVRVAAGTHRGSRGMIRHIPAHSAIDAAGLRTRCAIIDLENGERVSLPLHLLDVVG
ncbi:MAG TPA: hypothetical protein VFN11_13585 [Ktedonobacterales bacterium]|nr:hypothetical protein [Ktedonobacterales bacterium]